MGRDDSKGTRDRDARTAVCRGMVRSAPRLRDHRGTDRAAEKNTITNAKTGQHGYFPCDTKPKSYFEGHAKTNSNASSSRCASADTAEEKPLFVHRRVL